MVQFNEVDQNTFLKQYWQKKPLVIRQALPGFINPLSPDELAGLAMEEEIESRLVFETPNKKPFWHLKKGPFLESDFTTLSKTHWTLLVQGVDRFIPAVYELLEHFNFIPQWRIDDVMISYATQQGSVGPHYDHYDVFLYQAKGRRKWSLTTQNCTPDNAISDIELRLMKEFNIEEEYLLEEGDMLYLPPHVGHYGISLSDQCMTYSFGYRSYTGQELWDSLGDYLSEREAFKVLYQDPDWSSLQNSSELSVPAWKNAQTLLLKLVNDEQLMQSWFGCFATRLDHQAEQLLSESWTDEESITQDDFISALTTMPLERDPCCRFSYLINPDNKKIDLYINGCEWDTQDTTPELIRYIANNRFYTFDNLSKHLDNKNNQQFLFDLWKLGFICSGTANEYTL